MRHLAILLAAALAGCGGSKEDEPPDADPCDLAAAGAPWLAFASRRSGDYEIWRARADGTCLRQVTREPGPDLAPTWAGGRVVFASERGGVQGLWTHDLATASEAAVEIGDLAAATSPAFSPDGAQLAFEGRAVRGGASNVYVVPAEGGPARLLEATPGGGAGPAWAPDGRTVYFVSTRSGAYEVWAVPAEGGDASRLTTGSRIVGKPAVTSDGAALVYARPMSGSSRTELVRQALSTGAVTVISSLDDSEPAVSGDGQRLALRSFRAGHADVVIEDLDGGGAVLLTSDLASDGAPAFALPSRR